MDDERIIRFSLSGIFFVASLFAFDWILGGDLLTTTLNQKPTNIEEVTGILALLLSTPFIGVIVSAFFYIFLFWFPGIRFIMPSQGHDRFVFLRTESRLYDDHFPVPPHQKITNMKKLPLFRYRTIRLNGIIRVHQQLLRSKMNEKEMAYTSRRFTFYLTYINTTLATLFAWAITLIIHDWEPEHNRSCIRIFALLFYIGYVAVALLQAYYTLRESCQFEVDWVKFYAREEERKKGRGCHCIKK